MTSGDQAGIELVESFNRCKLRQLETRGNEMDPNAPGSCEAFGENVAEVQEAITVTYKLVAFGALRRADPAEAAELWQKMLKLCDSALSVLDGLRVKYPNCGTPQLYDLVLDYRREADSRYRANLEDAECLKKPSPQGLFPQKI